LQKRGCNNENIPIREKGEIMNNAQELHENQIPALPTPVLHREILVQTLVNAIRQRGSGQSSLYKLIWLCAPAGYGKTTLLVDAANQLSSICCWSLLHETDADFSMFLQRLYASIRRCFPAFGRQVAPFLARNETDVERCAYASADPSNVLDALLNAFKNEITEPFVLLLCNYHEIDQNEAINQFVGRLIADLPPHGVLVIESQSMPNLVLAPLIARGQMFGMGTHELRFTPQEVYDLACLQGKIQLSLPDAEQLANAFEGWIAGILLGSRLGYAHFLSSALPSAENGGGSAFIDHYRQLLTYITNEVFKHETSTLEFLKETSLLTRLVPGRCDALLGTSNAAARLAYAEQRGLFVTRDRTNGDAYQVRDYICHPMLRQLLAEYLHQQAPERYRTLHSQVAHLLRAEGQYEQALAHAYQAQEYHLATSIILEIVPALIYEEHSEQLLHWLELLPEELFNQHPQLLLLASNIHLRQGNFSLVPPLLDAAEVLLNNLPTEEDRPELLLLQAELYIARGHLFFFQGHFQHTQELCRRALTLLPPDECKLRIRAYQYLGVSLIVGAAQMQEGITQLQQALQISRSQQNEQQVATLHRLVANAYSWIGNHALAEYHQTRAFRIWKKLNKSQGIIYSLSSMGLLKMRQGFIQQAEELLGQALYESRDIYHFKSGEAYTLLALGELHNNRGQYVEALNYLEDEVNLARQCEDRYLTCCGLCNLAIAYVFLGDMQTAQFFLDQVFLLEGEKNSFESLLFHLTQGTVYLAQHDYDQAASLLLYTVEAARQASIQIISISALARLTVCYLKQRKHDAALQTGRCIVDLNKKGDFDFLCQMELHRYFELRSFLDQIANADSQKNAFSPIRGPAPQEDLPTQATPPPTLQGASSFQILALGEPRVIFNGIPVTRWRMARAMELFFFLLENGRPVRKNQIINALWPEQDRDQIDSTVRTTIYYVRKALGERSVIFRAGLYSLNLSVSGEKVWYDVEMFDEHYVRAKKALDAKDDEAARTAFIGMVELYNGDYVQSFYNDWCTFRRDKLRQAFMDAHHQLALLAWRREDWEDSLHHWQYLLMMDPCYELAHYNIMRCYLQQGKRKFALRQFQRCSLNLREELNIAPSAVMQELYQSIIE
jgi:LuxR family transcriptional regulator, maltose regulon positive regulatory protein